MPYPGKICENCKSEPVTGQCLKYCQECRYVVITQRNSSDRKKRLKERQEEMLEMRQAGLSDDYIASFFKITNSKVNKSISLIEKELEGG